MWRKLFDAPWPDAENLLPPAVQAQAEQRVRQYWRAHGWQLVAGEVVLFVAAWQQQVPFQIVYGLFALLMATVYIFGFVRRMSATWLLASSSVFLIQGIFINGVGAVTALTFIVPYTVAGMLLSGRKRFVVQGWCMLGFWASLVYGIVPFLPQLTPPNHLIISYDVLLAVFTFQSLRFLSRLSVEINSVYVAEEIRGQSRQFLARVSHELRTPLNSVLGFAKLLHRTELNDTQQRYLTQIVEESDQLNRLVSDLLDSAHLATGKLTLHLETCDVNALCRAVAEEHRPALGAQVKLHVDLADNIPTFQADSIRLRQAVGNLVSNAAKYTTQGEIRITTLCHDDVLRIKVRDTGIGITEAEQQLVFIPFVQLDHRRIGVGLGLDIALQIVRLHGGDIHLTSALGQGSEFTIELPIR